MFETIPSVDLIDFTSGNATRKSDFVKSLGSAFNEIGFVAVKNHGLSDEQSDKLYQAFKHFFELSEEAKAQYDIPGLAGQRGYTGKRKENAKGSKVADLKEFFHVGQENRPKEMDMSRYYPDNIWPKEVPELKNISIKAFKILENTGIQLLRAIALFLDLPELYFDEKVKTGNSILRAVHYFPITDPSDLKADAVRAGAHEDINLITLLMGASAEGLEILRKDLVWVPVTALPDQIIVNVGDMLARLTNDYLKSTTHKVINPSDEKLMTPRYSIPFFLHPRSDMDLTCLENCISIEQPKKYSDINAGEFLDQRLREIGLK